MEECSNVRSLFVFVFPSSSIPAPAPQIKLISISLIGLQLGTDSSTNRLQDSYTIQGNNRVFDLSTLLHPKLVQGLSNSVVPAPPHPYATPIPHTCDTCNTMLREKMRRLPAKTGEEKINVETQMAL